MKPLARRAGLSCLLFGWLLVCTCYAQLAVVAQSRLFSTLQVTSSSGTIEFGFGALPWTAGAFAQADSFPGGAFEFNFHETFDGTAALTSATSGFATGSATANPLLLSERARSDVSIPDGIGASSFAEGRSSLFNTFIVTGGVGTVDVTFSVDLIGTLSVLTSNLGVSATTQTNFALELDGSFLLFRHDELSIGPSASQNFGFAATLTATRSLEYDVPYSLLMESDSESRGLSSPVPESNYGLVAVALILLKLVINRRKRFAGQGISI